MRQGPWKLVSLSGQPWELYNLSTDRTETRNLATSNAAKAGELRLKYEAWIARMNTAVPVTLKVTTPDGGESWPAGSRQSIRWVTTNALAIDKVKLEYDAGSGWRTIAPAAPHTGDADFSISAPSDLAAPPSTFGQPFTLQVDGALLTFPRWTGAHPDRIHFSGVGGRKVRTLSVGAKACEAKHSAWCCPEDGRLRGPADFIGQAGKSPETSNPRRLTHSSHFLPQCAFPPVPSCIRM